MHAELSDKLKSRAIEFKCEETDQEFKPGFLTLHRRTITLVSIQGGV